MLHFRLQKESSSSGGPKELGYRKRNTRMALSAKAAAVALASRWQASCRHPKSSELRLHDRFLVVATARFEPARCKKQQKSSWGLRAAAARQSTRLRCREKSMRRLTALLQLKKGGC
jgi:hypothetical protein